MIAAYGPHTPRENVGKANLTFTIRKGRVVATLSKGGVQHDR